MSGAIGDFIIGVSAIGAPLPLDWTSLQAALQIYLQEVNSADFANIAQIISGNAEMRIYRELDFLATRAIHNYSTFTAGSRTVSFAALRQITIAGVYPLNLWPVVVQGINAITSGPLWLADDQGNLLTDENNNPLGTGTPPKRVRFVPASLDFIDNYWPDESVLSPPGIPGAYYTMLDYETLIVAPTPDQPYPIEIIGTWRPSPMGPDNPETWLGDNLPDLFFAACMVEAAAYQRNFGAASDDPKAALSWEAHYQTLKASALEEEQRKKSQGPGWHPLSPTPVTGQPRS